MWLKNFDYTISSMKKYQQWLEQKSYSQHLENLVRIKLGKSHYSNDSISTPCVRKSRLQTFSLTHSRVNTRAGSHSHSDYKYQSPQRMRLKLAPTQLQGYINKENVNLLMRIWNVKPVISFSKNSESYQNLRKHNKLPKGCKLERGFPQIQNMKKILKSGEHYAAGSRTSIIHIHLKQLGELSSAQYAEVWCQLSSGSEVQKSSFKQTSLASKQPFRFAIKGRPQKPTSLRVFYSKRLESKQLGTFSLMIPNSCLKNQSRKILSVPCQPNQIQLDVWQTIASKPDLSQFK